MVADIGVREDDTALKTDALADLSARANDNVGTDNGGRVDLGGLIRLAAAMGALSAAVLTGSTRTFPP